MKLGPVKLEHLHVQLEMQKYIIVHGVYIPTHVNWSVYPFQLDFQGLNNGNAVFIRSMYTYPHKTPSHFKGTCGP